MNNELFYHTCCAVVKLVRQQSYGIVFLRESYDIVAMFLLCIY